MVEEEKVEVKPELDEVQGRVLEALRASVVESTGGDRARSMAIAEKAGLEQWQARKVLRQLRVLGLASHVVGEEGSAYAGKHFWKVGATDTLQLEEKLEAAVASGAFAEEDAALFEAGAEIGAAIGAELREAPEREEAAKAETLPAEPETAPELDEVPPVVVEGEAGGEP